jgi:hypothetical protein
VQTAASGSERGSMCGDVLSAWQLACIFDLSVRQSMAHPGLVLCRRSRQTCFGSFEQVPA